MSASAKRARRRQGLAKAAQQDRALDTRPEAWRARQCAVVTIRIPVEDLPTLQRATVMRYDDAHLVDRMWSRAQLNDRRHSNAAALLALWRAAGLEPKTTADLSAGPRGPIPIPEADEAEAEDYFHREMKRFNGQPASLLMGMLRGQHPGTAWLATLQAALDRLDHLPAIWEGDRWRTENGA